MTSGRVDAARTAGCCSPRTTRRLTRKRRPPCDTAECSAGSPPVDVDRYRHEHRRITHREVLILMAENHPASPEFIIAVDPPAVGRDNPRVDGFSPTTTSVRLDHGVGWGGMAPWNWPMDDRRGFCSRDTTGETWVRHSICVRSDSTAG